MNSFARLLVITAALLSSFAFANVVGVGTQNFNPVTDGLDYVTVQSSKTLSPGNINIGGFLNYSVNSLPYLDTSVQSKTRFNDTLLSSDLNAGIGILRRLDAGISFPAVLTQSVNDDTGVHGQFINKGGTEIRPNAKYRFLGGDDGGVAAVFSVNFQRTVNDPYSGTDAGPTYNFELVADRTFANRITAAVNFGYRKRNSGTPIAGDIIEPLKDQYIASAAASYLFQSTDTKLVGEIFGAWPAQSQNPNPTRSMTSAEMLIGMKHDFTTRLAAHIGVGTELIQGVSSPDFRAYTGLNYTFGPVWGRNTVTKVESSGVAQQETFSVGNILFKFDSAEMVPGFEASLSVLVEELHKAPFKTITIEGHTDSVGKPAYNKDLSLRRANAIRDYLINSANIPASKIITYGRGSEFPIADNGNYQGRQANRRVEFKIER